MRGVDWGASRHLRERCQARPRSDVISENGGRGGAHRGEESEKTGMEKCCMRVGLRQRPFLHEWLWICVSYNICMWRSCVVESGPEVEGPRRISREEDTRRMWGTCCENIKRQKVCVKRAGEPWEIRLFPWKVLTTPEVQNNSSYFLTDWVGSIKINILCVTTVYDPVEPFPVTYTFTVRFIIWTLYCQRVLLMEQTRSREKFFVLTFPLWP